MTETLPLASDTWDDAELRAIEEVVRSRRFTMGSKVAQFETELARFVGARHAVMVNSGSSANLIALAAIYYMPDSQLKEGGEVIVPAVSWSTTYYPVHQLGLTLSFVDIDPDTLNFDLDKLEQAITDRTQAILAVNLLGNPNNFDRLRYLCERHDLILIEDNCESMGATFRGKAAGTFGLCGTYSSFYSHHIATMEGGLVVTDDTTLYRTMISLRAHGWTREQEKGSHLYLEADPFTNLFRFVLPGYNVRPLEMEGALGTEQLKKLPKFIEKRRANARVFQELFGNIESIRIQREVGDSSWFGFALTLRGTLAGRRKELVARLVEAKVECRPIVAGNFLRNPVIRHLRHVVRSTVDAADAVDNNGLFIGNHHFELVDQLERVRNIISQLEKTTC